MSVLWTPVDFENNKLYDIGAKGFDYIGAWGGSMAVNAASKYEGTYGCEISPMVGWRILGAKRINNVSRFRQAFYLHPNAIAMSEDKYFVLGRDYHSDTTWRKYMILFRWTEAAGYQIQIGISDNTGGIVANSSIYALPTQAGWNLIEMEWISGSPGSFQLWLDGVSKGTINATNNLIRLVYPSLGSVVASGGTITGSFYIDNWRANDDGTEIGA